MDSPLALLDQKGNLSHALALYNPLGRAEKVVHFTPSIEDRRFACEFEKAGIEIYPYFDGRIRGNWRRAMHAVGALLRVCKKLRSERINIIRARLPYLGGLLGALAGRMFGIPSVVSLGGDNRLPQEREGRYYFGSRFVSYTVEKLTLLLCSAIIAPNHFTWNYVAGIIGHHRAQRKIHVIPWIFEKRPEPAGSSHETLDKFGLSCDLPVVICVGILNRYKFSDVMFAVAREMSDEVQFIFCGDGPLRAEGEQFLRDHPKVRFIGWQPNEIVLNLLMLSSIVLVPMSGFVLLEAASLGKPVITTNIEWHGELVEDGNSGLLVTPTDIQAWMQAIRRLLSDPFLAANMGKNLKRKFDSEYNPKSLLDREVKLYEALIERCGCHTGTCGNGVPVRSGE